MSWLFSRALVAEFSAGTCSDGDASAPLNVMPTQHKFWRNDKTMEPSQLSRFGLTCAVLTERRGEELLMSYRAGFRAKTSAAPETEPESTESALGSGGNSHGWFATFDPATSSWRTAQCSLLGDSELFSETWPRWGSMRNGASYLRPIPALPICVSASGLWPTPVADDTGLRRQTYAQGGTPLSLAAVTWPTPNAGDYKAGMSNAPNRQQSSLPRTVGIREGVSSGRRGGLNPTWVEWLMGWPIQWTELKQSATARFPEWQQQHGIS